MASRPVYHSIDKVPFYEVTDTEFTFYSGFSVVQKQKSIQSLHTAYCALHPDCKVLEISSKSQENLGVKLSAFNLCYQHNGKKLSVESTFQGSKVFEGDVQYKDLYEKSSVEAKKDTRLKTSGELKCFRLFEEEFPLQPVNYFYNWLYISAISMNFQYANELLKYDSFTDIEFNPKKSFNCQAMAAAIFVGLHKAGKWKEAMESKEKFLEVVYGIHEPEMPEEIHQISLFEYM